MRYWCYLRILSGRPLPTITDINNVTQLEKELVIKFASIYPSSLFKRNSTGIRMNPSMDLVSVILEDMKWIEDIASALVDETGLSKLLNQPNENDSILNAFSSFCILFSVPSNTNFSPITILASLFFHAVYSANLKRNCFSFEDAREELLNSLRDIGLLFKLKHIKVPAIIQLEGDFETLEPPIELNECIIRKPTEFEIAQILPSSERKALVIETYIDFCINAYGEISYTEYCGTDPFSNLNWITEKNKELEELNKLHELADTIRLCLILAAEEKPIPTTVCGTYISTPVSSYSSFKKSDSLIYNPFSACQSQNVVGSEIKKWFEIVQNSGISAIAVKRLLSALSNRIDNEDALLDLLIVLETLFGSESEISFQISTAVAYLLSPKDKKKRKTIYEKVRRAYKIRSAIVHGRSLNNCNLYEEIKEFGPIVLEVMRTFLDTRSDLLQLKASERINIIILEA